MSTNTTVSQKITPQDVADRLKMPLVKKGDTSQSWRGDAYGTLLVNSEPINFEVYAPYFGSRWSAAGDGDERYSWDRAEIRINGNRFRRSKQRKNEFDWVMIESAFMGKAAREKADRALQESRDSFIAQNEPHAAALRKEFDQVSEYAITPSRSAANKVKINLGSIECSPGAARILLTTLYPKKK